MKPSQIKFRVWNCNKKEFFTQRLDHRIDIALEYWELNKHVEFPDMFTGLIDKNDKDIYEGDIVFWEGKNRVFVYGDGCFAFEGTNNPFVHIDQFKAKQMEIIGNIHQNPELLK